MIDVTLVLGVLAATAWVTPLVLLKRWKPNKYILALACLPVLLVVAAIMLGGLDLAGRPLTINGDEAGSQNYAAFFFVFISIAGVVFRVVEFYEKEQSSEGMQ